MNTNDIQSFLNSNNYDIRKTNNGRWIDQKCTMDVLCLVSDCIVEYVNNKNSSFSVRDIWSYEYTVENVQNIFDKPDPIKKASNEYDKYFGQPIKLLEAAGIIKGIKKGNTTFYSVDNNKLLEYISFKERNSFNFLCMYIEKVLKDSGIYDVFETFFEKQDKNSFIKMKNTFIEFTIKNTPINGKTECGRIFTKVLNPLAHKYKKLGTEKGYISKDIISQDKILYNQKNWRDIYLEKPKNLTREEYVLSINAKISPITAYKINRAKKNLRKFNDEYRNGKSELLQNNHMNDNATQIHHIFPVNEYPTIADYLENLIALTPTQHFSYAHPNNNTQYIDKKYQYLCLIAKTGSIKENLLDNEHGKIIYEFKSYQFVLDVGLKTEEFSKIAENDFDSIIKMIDIFYNDDN